MRRFIFALMAAFFLAVAVLGGQNGKNECGEIRRPEVSLAGTKAALCWANYRAELEGVPQVRSAEARRQMIDSGELLNLSLVPHIRVNRYQLSDAEPDKRHLYGWALERLGRIAADYHGAFGKELLLNSAHRTEAEQLALLARQMVILRGKPNWVRVNVNAAGISGPDASPHLRPATVDIARTDGIPWSLKPIPAAEDAFLKRRFLSAEAEDCLEATLEVGQAVYHVTFYKTCGAGLKALVAMGKGGQIK